MGRDLYYEVIRSARKTFCLQVKEDGRVIVRAPLRARKRDIDAFVEDHLDWIEKQLKKTEERNRRRDSLSEEQKLSEEEIRQLAKEAGKRIPERVAVFALAMGVSYGRITIRCQKTRWGSCGGKGNLNFNCLLMLLPEEILDYVVVHELCHLKQMNHSPAFWAEVEKVLPDYKQRRKELRRLEKDIFLRL